MLLFLYPGDLYEMKPANQLTKPNYHHHQNQEGK